MKDLIHFAHGNGFPSPCYSQLIKGLKTQFDCCYIDRIGHNPDFPVNDNWSALVDEVILSIQTQALKPVIAVGHSLGGVLSLIAAIKQPELFKAVVMLDSPLLGRFKSNVLRISKLLGMIDHVTPAYQTRGRRTHWNTREEVVSYLKEKKLFKNFTPACLNDYVDYGLLKDDSGYSLRFKPDIEYNIFRTIPHKFIEYEGLLTVPTALIYGNKSGVIDATDLYYMKKHYGIEIHSTEGTHMFPMEYPVTAANLIIEVIQKL